MLVRAQLTPIPRVVASFYLTAGSSIRAGYEPVLRGVLFRIDLRDAHVTTGVTIITGEDR